jgi:hypothetical protein
VPEGHGTRWTRRQFIAGGLGLVSAAAAGIGISAAWTQLGREDLIPGEPLDLELPPEAWEVSDDRLSFVALGDNGSGGRQAVEVAAQMCRSYRERPYGLVSLLGDICYYGPIDERFDAVFLRPLGPLIDAGVRFELAVGNHDGPLFFRDGVPDVERTLELLGTPARSYAVSRGPVDFFYLDSAALLTPIGEEDQLAWLDRALSAATKPWRIVCLHHPMYSGGAHGSAVEVRRVLEPVLARHEVDLTLAGHDHHYERSVPIEGITHVVSGGGCKLTPVDPEPHTAFARSTLQFMRFDVDRDELVGRAIDIDGQTIDEFRLQAKDRR